MRIGPREWRPASLLVLAALFACALSTGAPAMAARSNTTIARITVAPIQVSAHLNGIPTIVQTLNNCGPASIAEVLQYWGITRTQWQVQAVVRADASPRGMAPFGVPGYMRSLGLRGLLGVGGTQKLLKGLISNGFPVIVSQWVSATDQIRHYRPIVAYDDRRSVFVSSDPYLGAGHRISYREFAQIWAVSRGRFLVLYPPARRALLDAVLRQVGWSHNTAYRQDLQWQQLRLRHVPAGDAGFLARYYGYASVAWDQMELRDFTGARRTLQTAAARGASPVVLGWIAAEIAWRVSGRS